MNYRIIIILLFLFYLPVSIYPFGKNKVNYEEYNWRILKTIHFDIYFPDGLDELALESARIAEEGYIYISNYLKHELTDIIPIIVYPSHISFQNNNILPFIIGEGTGGFTESLKSRIVIPFTGSYHELRHVLTHELVHAFQYNILLLDTSGENLSKFSVGRLPLWIMEGMAEYLSAGFDETADMVMRDALYNEKYASLKDLTMLRVSNIYLLYKEGQAFFFFLEKKYGKHVAGELFRDLRDIRDIEKAIKLNTGKEFEELDKEWIRFFKKRYFHLVKDKNFDDDEGEQITFHEKTHSSLNICPAVSPDGKKIAYVTNRDIYSNLVITSINKKKDKPIKILIKGNTSSKFEGMHLMSNYLTWIKNGNLIAFVAQSNGRDIIYLIDSKTGDIKNEFKLPVREIKDPSISSDGKLIAFAGSGNGSSDIFIYNCTSNKMKRITDDRFSERYPKITSDNKNIIYSSNWNKDDETDSNNYDIYKINIISGQRDLIISGNGNQLQADISKDGNKIIYISNVSGIYNAYVYNFKTGKNEKVTDVLSGIFYPRWFPEGKRIAFVAYQNSGYDIFTKNLNDNNVYPDSTKRETEHKSINYPESYFNLSQATFTNYKSGLSNDWFMLGLTGTVNYGLVAFAQMSMSDLLADHRMILTLNYIRQNRENDFNFDVAYFYLKNRWDFGLGAFRQKNPFIIYTFSDINDLIHNVNYGTLYMNHYGGYGIASYPVSKFLRFDIKGSISRFERDYSVYDSRQDVYANLNKLSLSISYDNVLWGQMVPADGTRGRIEFEQSFNISGQDFTYSSIDIDVRHYFLISKRYVFALRGIGGKIFGKDSEYFKYYLGGYNTLRGHPFLGYKGENMILFNTEFRFIAVEGIKLGWPLFLGIGRIGGVLFMDFGTIWDGKINFIDREAGEFDDFKTDFGFGLRFAVYPLIIFKLDFAWPVYMKSVGDMEIIFSLGFEY